MPLMFLVAPFRRLFAVLWKRLARPAAEPPAAAVELSPLPQLATRVAAPRDSESSA